MQNVGLINRAPVKWVGNSGVAAKKSLTRSKVMWGGKSPRKLVQWIGPHKLLSNWNGQNGPPNPTSPPLTDPQFPLPIGAIIQAAEVAGLKSFRSSSIGLEFEST